MLTSMLLKMTVVGAEWVLWLLVLLSIASVSIIVERCMYFYRHRFDGNELFDPLQERLRSGDLRAAWELIKESETIEGEVVAAGLLAVKRGMQACSEAMLSAKARLRPHLDSQLSTLATIGSNAPFIGLLGTVLGIIRAAHDLAGDGGQGNPAAVMAGVFEALVATAVGLFVAIPALMAFNLFQRQVKKHLAQVDALAHLVLATVRLQAPPSAAGSPVSAPSATPAKVS
jgi:biopolymer transport protein ExbB